MNLTRWFIRVVSSQGIKSSLPGLDIPSSRDCHPSTRSDLLPMSPVCTPPRPSSPSLPPDPPGEEGGRRGATRNPSLLFSKLTTPSSPGGRGGGWEKRAGVMRAPPAPPRPESGMSSGSASSSPRRRHLRQHLLQHLIRPQTVDLGAGGKHHAMAQQRLEEALDV